jgi:spermidine synthase
MKLNFLFTGTSSMPEGKIVHSTSDTYGNILVVDYPRYRVLSFDSIYEQSGFYLEKPYALVHEYIRIMMLVLGFVEPRHATLLGLGGGSLLRSLHHYLSHCEFHVVELRPKVYDIALEYFDIPDDERVWVSIEDAKLQIQSGKSASTDIIFADLYDAYHMSPLQTQKQFVQECCRTLTKNGWLLINFHRLPDTSSAFFKVLTEYFSTLMLCSGEFGNHILFACKSSNVDYDSAPVKLKKMEKVLNENFMPLYHRLKPLSA